MNTMADIQKLSYDNVTIIMDDILHTSYDSPMIPIADIHKLS
jgi:hypothetical protein